MTLKNMCALAAVILASGSMASAAMLEQVNLSGSAGHSTIQSAVTAVSDGGTVEIIEGGTYTGQVVIPGGKTFTIRATASGVVSENSAAVWNIPRNSTDAVFPPGTVVLGTVNVTLDGFTLRRTAGTGTVFDIDQRAASPVTVTLNNMTVEHVTSGGSGGEAIKIDDGDNGATGNCPTLTLNATNCTIRTDSAAGSGKSAIRVQSDATDIIDNLTVNLTNCTLSAVTEGVIRTDGRNNQNFTLTGCTLTTVADRGFEVDDPTDNSTFSLTNTTITSGLHAILANDAGVGNDWILNRCTFDNASGALPARAIQITYTDSVNNPVTNTVSMYNCVVKSQQGVSNTSRGISMQDVTAKLYHNTFIAAGTGGARVYSSSASTSPTANGTAIDAQNNLIINYKGEDQGGGVFDIIGGSVPSSHGNVVVGPTDDSGAGTTHSYTLAAESQAAAIAAAVVNPTTLVPLSGSPANGYGFIDGLVAAAVGNDRNGNSRPNPIGSNPDSGAFETSFGGSAAVEGWMTYD